jgi:hypothetical protein
VKKLAAEDHSNHDCLAVFFLSHGDSGRVNAYDRDFFVEELFMPFHNCPSLLGKPKLFFIQACRGKWLDHGQELCRDVADSAQLFKIPTWADYLISYSTVDGYYSWRNADNGSWFIQALVAILGDTQYNEMDILSLMTLVNRKVAYEYVSRTNDPDWSSKKQVPCILNMLTRRLFLKQNQTTSV